MRKVLLILTAAFLFGFAAWSQHSPVNPRPPGEDRTAQDFAQQFFIFADPNETDPQIPAAYWEARGLIIKGEWDKARAVLQEALRTYPDSRHLHAQLAELLWYYYQDRTPDQATLEKIGEEASRAIELGLAFGKVDATLTPLLGESLGRTGDAATLDRIFSEALARDPNSAVYVDYAKGLDLLGDRRAERIFQEGMRHESDNPTARLSYAEWLIDHDRNSEALELLPPHTYSYVKYTSLLRGVALERLGRLEEAKEAYSDYVEFSKSFPAPLKFKSLESLIQREIPIRFEDQNPREKAQGGITSKLTDGQTLAGLAYLLLKEARNESIGAIRAEGWVVRNRVLRGNTINGCPTVRNDGSTLADKYKTVMCDGNGSQFNGVCLAWCSNPNTTLCPSTTGTSFPSAASDVYYGYAPDPVANFCAGGGTNYCDPNARCNAGTDAFKLGGGVFNFGTTGSCSTFTYSSCAPPAGKTCPNAGADNCFYVNTYWNGQGPLSGTLTSSTRELFFPNNSTHSYTSSTSKTHRAHLEGPDTANMDLELQKQSGLQWATVSSSKRSYSEEDVSYSGTPGTYRWRVSTPSGSTGSFKLWITNP